MVERPKSQAVTGGEGNGDPLLDVTPIPPEAVLGFGSWAHDTSFGQQESAEQWRLRLAAAISIFRLEHPDLSNEEIKKYFETDLGVLGVKRWLDGERPRLDSAA